MQIVEIRDLDGPNFFLLEPALKIELRIDAQDVDADRIADLAGPLEALGVILESHEAGLEPLADALVDAIVAIHQRAGQQSPDALWRALETPHHIALVFGWKRREFALAVGELVGKLTELSVDEILEKLAYVTDLARTEIINEDRPQLVRDSERTIPIVGVTGTNGKTTTTRLIAAVLRHSGQRVGWSSSSGVYIDGDEVLHGDYTGPVGARRVLEDPSVEIAVLETARGGILLRGLAYESNDVSVFTNVSPDHLDTHGIRTLDGLAEVKATVVRVTRAEGYAVLNADDPLVAAQAGRLRASVIFVTQDEANPIVEAHVSAGGQALVVRDEKIYLLRSSGEMLLTALTEVPITFGGRAKHMVENALCAAAACLALKTDPDAVREGLAAFRNVPEQNTGRLNVFDVEGVTVIVDFAHNEAGLRHLLQFGGTFVSEGGRLVSIIGTAGDRPDSSLKELGRLAATESDHVIIKDTVHYLRGREPGEMPRLIAEELRGHAGVTWDEAASELPAVDLALEMVSAGDVVAMMCIEEYDEVLKRLGAIGHLIS
ncbi:MAG: Mur ligase family protein [Chloroflexota bacterium]|nr:Mur ligase family protein [Chloroflexota bacterium]